MFDFRDWTLARGVQLRNSICILLTKGPLNELQRHSMARCFFPSKVKQSGSVGWVSSSDSKVWLIHVIWWLTLWVTPTTRCNSLSPPLFWQMTKKQFKVACECGPAKKEKPSTLYDEGMQIAPPRLKKGTNSRSYSRLEHVKRDT